MIVTTHAIARFVQRVDGDANPTESILKMWWFGRIATADDMSLFHADRKPGYRYRVGEHKLRVAMLVEHNERIVTLLPL